MASVNIASPFMQLILGYSFILCTGTLSYLGRTLGEQNADKAKNIFRIAAAAVVTVSVVILLKRTIVNIFEGRFHWNILTSVVYNGSSEGINYLATALILFLFNRAFMSVSGADGVAAFTVINYIGNFTTIVIFGISDGIGSIVSCNFGAGKTERVRQTVRVASIVNFLLGAGVLALLFCFSERFVGLFVSHNPSVMEMAVHRAKIYGIGFLFNGYNIVQSGYHTSVGHALASATIAASRGIVFIVIGVAILPRLLGQSGIWAILPFAELVTAFCCILLTRYHR